MLKSFSTLNFIHFTKAQRLEFKGGVNFFIGGNSSGKSAVLELIRRCLSHKINTTYSSFNVNHDIAYAVSHFEFPAGILPTNGLHVSKQNLKHAIACIFVNNLLDDTNPEKPFHYYKVICTIHLNDGADDADDQVYVFVRRYRGAFASDAEALDPLDTSMFCSKWEKRKLDCIIKHGSNSSWDDGIKILFNEIKAKTFNNYIECDEDMSKIYSCIENRYVGVMPMRSIGPLQWTRSKRNNHDCRDENYKIASDRAEILSELLGSDQVDKELEEKFCEALSLPCEFKQDVNDGQIKVYFHDKSDVPRPLLKTPEGVLEAKQLALILSHRQLLTITLEEPDHGMHPHMVNKVREEVLKKVSEYKTVLVTSHQSAILDHETMNRTFLFSERKTTDAAGKGRIHSVHLIPNDNKRFGCTEEMKQMLFSSITLFVPGYTDRLIIEAVFALSINSEPCINKMLGNIGDRKSTADFRKYLSRIHVIEMHGETSGPKKKKFCNDIGRRETTFMLYDFDMVQLEKPPQLKIGGKKIGLEFSLDKEFRSLEEFYNDRESFKTFQDACNNDQVFVWKYGSIESVINQIECNMNPALKEKMEVPIPNKAANKRSAQNWKAVLADRDADDIQELGTALIDHSDEIKRFFQFLKLMNQ